MLPVPSVILPLLMSFREKWVRWKRILSFRSLERMSTTIKSWRAATAGSLSIQKNPVSFRRTLLLPLTNNGNGLPAKFHLSYCLTVLTFQKPFITTDKILISIRRTAMIIWIVKIIRIAGIIFTKRICLSHRYLQRVGII